VSSSGSRRSQPPGGTTGRSVAQNSLQIARWTLVSRFTGLARVAVIGAVLGPTFFGNLYQSANLLPYLTYQFLTGTIFTALLVPPFVRALDRGGRTAAERLAGGFLGVALVAFAVVAVVLVVAGPLLLSLLGLGLDDPQLADEQRRLGMLLLILLMPQLAAYGIAGVGAAAMNARGRFALAAGAPALENLGTIATLLLAAQIWGTGRELGDVSTAQAVFLGAGSTVAVVLHAGVQSWGAHRAGLTLRPRFGWADPDVRGVLEDARPSLGFSSLGALRIFGTLIVANAVAGGVVAFQLALNFYNVLTALVARSVSTALLAGLSRLWHGGDRSGFRAALDRGMCWVLFLAVPASLALGVMSLPIARAVTFGDLSSPAGEVLVAACLASLALGSLADAIIVLHTTASYARADAAGPVRSMLLRLSVSVPGMVSALLLLDGVPLLIALGVAVSAGDVLSAAHLSRRSKGVLPPGAGDVARAAGQAAVAGLASSCVASAVALGSRTRLGGEAADLLALLAGGACGILVFMMVHALWRSPEAVAVLGRLRGRS